MGRMKREHGILGSTIQILGMAVLLATAVSPAARAQTTPNGVAVDHVSLTQASEASTIAVDDLCPCHGPITGGSWARRADYRACVTRSTAKLLRAKLITRADARARLKVSRASSCGKPAGDLAGANVRVCMASPDGALGCPMIAGAHVDGCGECAAALEGRMVTCATVGAADASRTVCGKGDARSLAGSRRVLDVRTGIDCGSCEAKLGTDRPEGVTCLAGACGPIP